MSTSFYIYLLAFFVVSCNEEYEISKLTENLNKDSLMQDSANLEHLSRAKDKFDSLIHN